MSDKSNEKGTNVKNDLTFISKLDLDKFFKEGDERFKDMTIESLGQHLYENFQAGKTMLEVYTETVIPYTIYRELSKYRR